MTRARERRDRRQTLRTQAEERDGPMCVWPGCPFPHVHMAHIRGVGMGGRPSADTLGGVAMMCRYHHDLLDGRTHSGLRREVGILLGAYIDERRPR